MDTNDINVFYEFYLDDLNVDETQVGTEVELPSFDGSSTSLKVLTRDEFAYYKGYADAVSAVDCVLMEIVELPRSLLID